MDSVPLPPSPPGPNVVFDVDYETLSLSSRNVDLQGKGTFTVEPGGTYWFTGNKRGAFSREETSLCFTALDIVNVGVSGRAVWFSTTKGKSGASEKPFIFMCRNEAEAAEVVRLLPAHVDEHFIAVVGFQEKLRQLPGARRPVESVTNVVIGLNALVFLAMVVFLHVGVIDVPDTTPYGLYGANNGAQTTSGEWWRLLTCMFMHYGVIHLGFNMWALAQTGRLVERLQGRALYAITYLASGVGGGFASILFSTNQGWSAGASGAVFGVYGALLGFMLKEKQALPKLVFQSILKSTLAFAGYNVVFGLAMPNIGLAAHAGGFVVGGVFGWLTAMPVDAAVRPQLVGKKLRLAAAAGVVMIALGVAITPRFNYSTLEEIAWGKALKGVGEQENQLITRQTKELERFRETKGENRAAFSSFIENQLVPFYRDIARRIDVLDLSPHRLTNERRTRLKEFIQIRLESYQHLLRAVKDQDDNALNAYFEAETREAKVIEAMKQLKQQRVGHF